MVASPNAPRLAGRKKGSRNKDKVNVALSPELTRLQTAVLRVLGFTTKCLSLHHLVLDGEYGHNAVAQKVAQPLERAARLRGAMTKHKWPGTPLRGLIFTHIIVKSTRR